MHQDGKGEQRERRVEAAALKQQEAPAGDHQHQRVRSCDVAHQDEVPIHQEGAAEQGAEEGRAPASKQAGHGHHGTHQVEGP